MIPSHWVPNFDPIPSPEAVVTAQNIRVTVLTSRLLRIEYSPINQFEDRPSQPFWFRNFPLPEFSTKTSATLNHGSLSTKGRSLVFSTRKPVRPVSAASQAHRGSVAHFQSTWAIQGLNLSWIF